MHLSVPLARRRPCVQENGTCPFIPPVAPNRFRIAWDFCLQKHDAYILPAANFSNFDISSDKFLPGGRVLGTHFSLDNPIRWLPESVLACALKAACFGMHDPPHRRAFPTCDMSVAAHGTHIGTSLLDPIPAINGQICSHWWNRKCDVPAPAVDLMSKSRNHMLRIASGVVFRFPRLTADEVVGHPWPAYLRHTVFTSFCT